ncbi:S-adenosyl-L-methionine-dependent methyltransferase [Mycena polygramma]|nr:S-adenosyl-L-methionine-dependent methyltransferase [Mycena polygramma]
MRLGYSVSVTEQCASNFGVPQTRRRLVLFASRRGLTHPDFPNITHTRDSQDHLPIMTLRDAISDLNHENPRFDNEKRNPVYIRSAGHSEYTEYTTQLGSQTVKEISNHATGYRRTSEKVKTWPKAQWDEPLCTVRTMPGNRWECLHPDGQRLLSVRELCRIQSFPDHWQLAGPIKVQYRQVGNAVPPLLAEAWAWALRTAILTDYPSLEGQFREHNVESSAEKAISRKMGNAARKRSAGELDLTSEEELGGKTKRMRGS